MNPLMNDWNISGASENVAFEGVNIFTKWKKNGNEG
jgi:hypothetical protein